MSAGDVVPQPGLDPLPCDPLTLLRSWSAEAAAPRAPDATAMTLATADPSGVPTARTVMVTAIDAAGLAFHTSAPTRKTRDLAANPLASGVFGWLAIGRQVVVCGGVETLTDQELDAAFANRPRQLQLLAWVYDAPPDPPTRTALAQRYQHADERWRGAWVPRPGSWTGYRLVPDVAEFWWRGEPTESGGLPAINERVRYLRGPAGWTHAWVLP